VISPVLVLLALGAVLLAAGVWGRRHAATLGHVPGLPADLQEHRIAVIRRGALTCAVVGAAFLVLAGVAPLL
jgi:hypothetical protein